MKIIDNARDAEKIMKIRTIKGVFHKKPYKSG